MRWKDDSSAAEIQRFFHTVLILRGYSWFQVYCAVLFACRDVYFLKICVGSTSVRMCECHLQFLKIINGHTQIHMMKQPRRQERNVLLLLLLYAIADSLATSSATIYRRCIDHATETHIKPAGFEPT